MVFKLNDAMEILERTPAVLRTMLSGLNPIWVHSSCADDTFSPFDIVGHLIHGEQADWMTRARIILEHGTRRLFEPFDRYAQFEESRGKSLTELLDTFERLRTANLDALRTLGPTTDDLKRRGMHPALGEVTLQQLLSTWVVHDLNHLAQVAKCMATQYSEEVGPWREYLSILKSPAVPMDAEGAARARKARGQPS